MKVTVVGTSCTWFNHLNTSYVVDNFLLIDTPQGNYKSIKNIINIEKDLKYIVFTHFHSDHFGDVHIYFDQIRKRTKRKLTIIAPAGAKESLAHLLMGSALGGLVHEIDNVFNFITIENGSVVEIENGKYKLTFYELNHGPSINFGFKLENTTENKIIGFTGDTILCDNLHNLIKGCDVVFSDVTADGNVNNISHIYISQFLDLKNTYNKVKFIPVHLSDSTRTALKNLNEFTPEDGQEFKF